MPWKETHVYEERVRFVAEHARGEWTMRELCERYGISRKTGYKFLARYAAGGVEALGDQSTAPHKQGRRVVPEVEAEILKLKKRRRTWGAPKLRDWLIVNRGDQEWPATSTIHEILRRHGFVRKRKRRYKAVPSEQPLAHAKKPNDVWCADFKGWFRTGDGRRCDPLTVTDAMSRYSLCCRGLERTGFAFVQPVLKRVFQEYGLPRRFRTDNGPPFSSRSFAGLSKLAIWLLHLDIWVERIDPGSPQQNGRHERFHLTLKQETASPPAGTLRGQQRRFNNFNYVYNEDRPHESLNGQAPASVYKASDRQYPRVLPQFEYPLTTSEYVVRKVTPHGSIRFENKIYYITETLVGEHVGLEQITNRRWAIHLGPLEIGVLDTVTKKTWAHRRLRYVREEPQG